MEGSSWLESSFAEKHLVVLVENEMAMSQQLAFVTMKANNILVCIRTAASRSGKVIHPLSALVRHIWSAGPSDGFQVQERSGHHKQRDLDILHRVQ